MDVEKFVSALELSISPDNDLRKEAESFIMDAMDKPHFIVAMLQIAGNPEYNEGKKVDINQAASIQLKNIVETHWRYKDDEYAREMKEEGVNIIIISDEDKAYVKENILEGYINVQCEVVAKQIDWAIRKIVKEDFPDNWPELGNTIKEYINVEDCYDSKVFVGLYTLKSVCKRYEYEFTDRRAPLNEIVDELFPRGEEIANAVIDDNSDQGCRLKNVIGQGFYIANQLQLGTRYKSTDALDALVTFFKTCLESKIDESLTTKTDNIDVIDHRIKSQQWKLKETGMHFLFRIFQKYGNPDFGDKTTKEISQHGLENYNKGLIDLSMELISNSHDIFIYAKVLHFGIKIITTAICQSGSFGFVKDHLETFITTGAIPMMLLTEKDIEDFESDPIEFIRKNIDSSTSSFYSTKSTVLELITSLIRFKSDPKDENALPDYLESFFNFGIENMKEYNNQESPDYRIKDALLLAIGQMSATLLKYSKFNSTIETLLKEGVFPDFTSENEFLRYRAGWMYGEFSRLPMDSEHMIEAGKGLFNAMSDHQLPIKLTASNSLYRMLRNKELKECFKSELARILEAYISLIENVDNEQLISGLEAIVKIYDDGIEPFAVDLCNKIVENYKKIVSKDQDEEYGALGMASSALVNTVKGILEAVRHNTELLLKLEPVVFPMVVNTLSPDGLEGLDEALEGMTLIMYHTKQVSNRMWSLFPQMLKIVVGNENSNDGGYAFDHLNSMEDYMRNLIFFGKEGMLIKKVGETPVMSVFLKSIVKVLQIAREEPGGLDAYICINLLYGLLEQLPGKIDSVVDFFMKVLVNELSNKKISKLYRLHVLQLMSYMLIYNAKLSLAIFQKANVFIPLFQNYFSSLRRYSELDQFRNLIYAITSLINLNLEDLPDIIKGNMTKILESLIKLMHKYTKEREREIVERYEDDLISKQLTESEIEQRNIVIEKLREIVDAENEKEDNEHDNDPPDDDDLDDDDYLWSRTDNFYYRSPLEQLEAPLYLRDGFQKMAEEKEDVYNQYIAVISKENMSLLENIIERGEFLQSLH